MGGVLAMAVDVTTPTDFPLAFAKKRIERKLNQTQAAKLIGVTQSTVSKWESGVDPPSPANYPKLARFMGVTQAGLEEMIDTPPGRLVQIGQELHRLIDELIDAAEKGRF